MTDLLTVDDLTPFASIEESKAEAMIDDATAMAVMAAPCLAIVDELSPLQIAAAKAILRSAVLRWNDVGSGAVTTEAAGPFSQSVDTRHPRRSLFWPSEITDLQDICKGITEKTGAFSVDTAADPQLVRQSFGGWRGGWSGSDGGFGWNDQGTFIPGNY